MREPLVSKLLRIALYLVFAAGVAGTVTLPFMIDFYTGYLYDAYYLEPGYRTFITIFLISAAIPALWAVLEAIRMLRSVPQGPFVMKNVHALRRIGLIFCILAVLFLAKCMVYVTFLTMCSGILFILIGLFAFTMSSLFRQAVVFKEENDLTI